MELSKIERETIILWNQAEDTVNISTFDDKLIKRLNMLSAKYPQTYVLDGLDQHGCLSATFPKAMLKVIISAPISDERRAKLSSLAKDNGLGHHERK